MITQDPSKLLVAVNFNSHAKRLVQSGVDLCQRGGMSLCLAHIVESDLHAFLQYGGNLLPHVKPDFLATIQNESVRKAESQLKELAQDVKGVEVEYSVHADTVGRGLVHAIKETRASIALVGSAKGAHKALLRGFSSALALMNSSPVPVMVFPGDSIPDFSKEKLSFLIADDLRNETASATELAYKIANRLNASEVLHLHVSTMTKDVFKAVIDSAFAAARNRGEYSANDLWDAARQVPG